MHVEYYIKKKQKVSAIQEQNIEVQNLTFHISSRQKKAQAFHDMIIQSHLTSRKTQNNHTIIWNHMWHPLASK